jgi:hypothetical protein
MTPLHFQVAKIAHNRNISELDEVRSKVTFAQEKTLACLTPSLEIARIRAVLNEANNVILGLQEMHAHDRRRPAAVTARYREGSFRGHVSSSGPIRAGNESRWA